MTDLEANEKDPWHTIYSFLTNKLSILKFMHDLNEYCNNFKELTETTAMEIKEYLLDTLIPIKIWTYMENVVVMVNETARATREQQQGTSQITKAVGNMRNLSEQVNRATTEQTRGTHHVLEAMASVTVRVQESSSRAQELAHYSADLARETHTLMELLQQFNIGDTERAIVPTTPSSHSMRSTR